MPTPDFPLPNGFGWQYHFILWIQSFHKPYFDHIAVALSYLGTESFYMFLLPIVFLTVNRKFGMRLAYVFLTSMFLNSWLKSELRIARPIGIPGVKSTYLSSATGLSMPSGHAQGPMTFFAALSRWAENKWLLRLTSVLVLLIGLTRIYLGLHWPLDVLIGWGLGLLVGRVGWTIGQWWSYRRIPFHFSIVFAVLFPAILFYFTHDGMAQEYAALLFALGTGNAIEQQFVHSKMDHPWWKRICAGIIGIAGLLAIQWALKGQMSELPWRLLKDLLFGWWATLAAPWLFLKLDVYRPKDASTSVD